MAGIFGDLAATGEHFFKRVVNICVFLREHGGVGGGGGEQFGGKQRMDEMPKREEKVGKELIIVVFVGFSVKINDQIKW